MDVTSSSVRAMYHAYMDNEEVDDTWYWMTRLDSLKAQLNSAPWMTGDDLFHLHNKISFCQGKLWKAKYGDTAPRGGWQNERNALGQRYYSSEPQAALGDEAETTQKAVPKAVRKIA